MRDGASIRPDLPIDAALPAIDAALAEHGLAVVIAPPGSGKTTRVPPALQRALAEGRWPGAERQGRVIVLQPRRVAARATAARMAEERGEALGQSIGYAVRGERRVSAATRIEVVTEGLLLRRLQADPTLEGVAAIVVDELHERSLDVDLAMAMATEVRRELRPDLRLVAMSATLDPGPVAALWAPLLPAGRAVPVFSPSARQHPVEIVYEAEARAMPLARDGEALAAAVVATVARAEATLATNGGGHVLVFLAGMAELRAAASALQRSGQHRDVRLLHGALPAAAQSHALAPSPTAKVVLATNVAETSITIDGVRAVVDSGLARQARWDPVLGVTRLEVARISAASADQRAGRAGRQGPGWCFRLWSRAEQGALRAYDAPEIAAADLSGALLQVIAWGGSVERFGWLQAPPADRVAEAAATLGSLGAIDTRGALTARGRALAHLPLPPRLGRVLLAGMAAGASDDAALVCALLAEGDIARGRTIPWAGDSDLDQRLGWLRAAAPDAAVDEAAWRRVRTTADELRRHLRGAASERPPPAPVATAAAAGCAGVMAAAAWVAAGFPDRVAARRSAGSERLLLASGRGATLAPTSSVRTAPLLVAIDLRAAAPGLDPTVTLAAALDPAWLDASTTCEELTTRWDPKRCAVVQSITRKIGAVTLSERPAGAEADREAAEATLTAAALAAPGQALALQDEGRALLGRLRCLARAGCAGDAPLFGDLWPEGMAALIAQRERGAAAAGATAGADDADRALVATLCRGCRSFADLQRASQAAALRAVLGHATMAQLDALAPERLRLASGAWARVRYTLDGQADAEVRVQDAFGHEAPLTVAAGRVALRVALLAPNGRPAAMTGDLAGFWRSGWAEVRRALRGRYPKHAWPEHPTAAEARPRRGPPL